jgi:hypothetical protein
LITHVCKPDGSKASEVSVSPDAFGSPFIEAILLHARPGGPPMNARFAPWMAWGLAVAAVAAGYVGYGWPGVVLAITVVVFWLLLQFSRALRVMKAAAGRPVGHVTSAVMLQSKLHKGMTLAQVMKLTGSFGQARAVPPADTPLGSAREIFGWLDEGGDEVEVELRAGKVTAWRLQRVASPLA